MGSEGGESSVNIAEARQESVEEDRVAYNSLRRLSQRYHSPIALTHTNHIKINDAILNYRIRNTIGMQGLVHVVRGRQ